jgi:hypothetical protein
MLRKNIFKNLINTMFKFRCGVWLWVNVRVTGKKIQPHPHPRFLRNRDAPRSETNRDTSEFQHTAKVRPFIRFSETGDNCLILKTTVTDGFEKPNKRSDFRGVLKP